MVRIHRYAFIGLIAAATSVAGCKSGHDHWSYEGDTGPAHWGDLKPEYHLAKTGKQQSPIDLRVDTRSSVTPLRIDYKPSAIAIVNNGHSIEVKYDEGSMVTLGSHAFALKQFHFHSPSEHTVDGKSFPIEMHLVHADADGKLAVIGVFMQEGEANATLGKVWAHLAEATGEPTKIPGATVDATGLLPSDRTRYTYAGSLTTPPCSEGVHWIVMKTPVEVSAAQITAFQAFYTGNNRPLQPLHGRVVKLGQ